MKGDEVRMVYERYRAQREGAAEQLGWNDLSSQQRNFKVVLDMLPPLTDLSVHDAGCGYADLFDFIKARGGCKQYIGTDFVPATVATAQERHPDLSIRQLDLLSFPPPQADVTLCFGALAFHKPRKVEEMLNRMWAASRVGLGFITWWNLTPEYVYFPEAEQLRKCIRRFLKSTKGKVSERLGDHGDPLEAAFVVLR